MLSLFMKVTWFLFQMCLKALSSQFPGSLRVKRLIAMKHEALNQLVDDIWSFILIKYVLSIYWIN